MTSARMLSLRTAAVLAVLAFALVASPPAAAQDYSFSLDREVVHAYWESDGTLSLDYEFVFTNQLGAHVIDFVDVGLPSGEFAFGAVTADVDGSPVTISSDFQGSGTGIAVDLGSRSIPPGQSATVHVEIPGIRNVLNADEDETYASAAFVPTWFGSEFVVGSTDLTVSFHFPAGVQPEEGRWHSAPAGFPGEPETALDSEGRVTYTWRSGSASPSQQYLFGASFPRTYVPADAIVAPSVLPAFDLDALAGIACPVSFCLIWVVIGAVIARAGQRRKLQYMAPRIAIEGHGIKRGLTAVEAAILLEQPLERVMTMILFGVLRKDAGKVVRSDPLEVQAASPLPEGLREYETRFLEAFAREDVSRRKQELHETIVGLVKSVSEKMKGFSRTETIAYYRRIVEKAWEQVQAAETPEMQSQYLDTDLEWTMMDKEYEDRSRRVLRGPIYVPNWWGNYDPSYTPARVGGTKMAAPAKATPAGGRALPQLPGADFAAKVAGSVETFSSKVVGNMSDFTSRVAGVTNPPPVVKATSRSSRSSGGCACACACAGCACACAGGGR